ncbi:hypothetical protein EV363DRAFT_1337251 [Boletus edulis]|uniref:CCL2-like lectin domain-containing protein n=1 Tax=Boletus edulis BED1 TaxID=1328754 RepID=A0AAD4GCP0_BOLED|nr:hypothetical protein EV363DRAFT_1337251 [Boletus edulis]KAF8436519.1 hypothetical protein L210DRAFT_3548245 [Boletus edulis BED1]
MSHPPEGLYFFINRETTDDGKSLAINFNGLGTPLTVTEFERLPTQIWRLRDLISIYCGTQFLEFQDTTLPIDIDNDGNLVSCVSPDRKWDVRGSESIYTIQDDAHLGFWGLRKAAVGERIAGSSNQRQYWRLIPVPVPDPPASRCTTM